MATSSSFTRGLQTSKSEAKELGEDTEVPVFSSIVENKKVVRIGGNTTSSSGAKYQLFIISDFTKKIVVSTTKDISTGGPLDMCILGLGKTHISGKSHSENQKVVILYGMIFLCMR